MSLIGSLTDCSISEIFYLIEKGKKTGLLSFGTLPYSPTLSPPMYYIWVERGRLVAAAKDLDHQGLLSQIEQSHWVRDRLVTKLVELCCPIDQPVGLCLKQQGVLQVEQLQKLFEAQVVQQVCTLLQLKEGWFKFEQNVPIPQREMTGLSVPATKAISSCRLRFLPGSISELLAKFSHAREISVDEQYGLMMLLLENSCTEQERDLIIRILRNAQRGSQKQMKFA